jgi:hypothetical protein
MMMRSGLAAVVVTLIGLGGAGCKSKSIAECDAYLAHAEKIASCEKIPESTRGTLKTVVKESATSSARPTSTTRPTR